jgi:hypothetical protein
MIFQHVLLEVIKVVNSTAIQYLAAIAALLTPSARPVESCGYQKQIGI